jgi:alkaline phosphatase D
VRFDFPSGELGRWAGLGDLTDRSVRVWYRDPAAAAAEAVISVTGRGDVASAELRPAADRDGVSAAELRLPEPAPERPFQVRVGDLRLKGILAPTPGSRTSFAFGFGSCHQPFLSTLGKGEIKANPKVDLYPQMQRVLEARGARFLALVGDQVYSDGIRELSVRELADEEPAAAERQLVEIYRHLYRGYFNEPGFRQLLEAFPAYMTWDDHDIVDGWGSLKDPAEEDRRLFRAAEHVYREYQHLRNPGGDLDDAPPYDYSFWYADVGFFFLDLRGVRDYQAGVVVGREQMARLEAFLAQAGAREVATVFVVASVPVVHVSPRLVWLLEWIPDGAGTEVRDRWSAAPFDHERNELLDRLADWQDAGSRRQVVILSGDVHVGACFTVRRRRGRGRLLQFTSSALCTPGGAAHALANKVATGLVDWGERHVRARLQALETDNNFGLVTVEPLPAGGHAVGLELFAMAGDRRSARATQRLRFEAR